MEISKEFFFHKDDSILWFTFFSPLVLSSFIPILYKALIQLDNPPRPKHYEPRGRFGTANGIGISGGREFILLGR